MAARMTTLTALAVRQAAASATFPKVRKALRAAVLFVCWLGWLGILSVQAADGDSGTPPKPSVVRIGIGPGIWQGVNRNDASAAIKVWTKAILNQGENVLAVETQIFETPEALSDALKNDHIDAATMLTDEFLGLTPELQPATVFIGTKAQAFTENYVLLVQRNAGISEVAGLAGRKLVCQSNSRTSLALPWFDTLLARQSMGLAETVLGSLTKNDSPSKAVLQVFFHQADACLVTSNVFALASELNPQLRKELKILAVSPAVVPALFFFRPGYTNTLRQQMESAILSMRKTPAGIQVLTVFQSDGMVQCPLASLDGTRQLLAEYERAKNRPAAATPACSLQSLNQNEPR